MKKHTFEIVLGLIIFALFLYMVKPFLDVFIYSFFLYHISRPIFKRFKKYVKSKTLAAAATLFLVVMPVTVATLYTIAAASLDIASFISTVDLPYVDDILKIIDEYSIVVQTLGPREIFNILKDARIKALWNTFSDLFWSLIDLSFNFFLVFSLTFYLLLDAHRLRKYLVNICSTSKEEVLCKFVGQVDNDISHVFLGNIVTALMTGVIGAVLFWMLNAATFSTGLQIPYPTMLGLMCGITSLVPIVGVALVWIPVGLYFFIQLYISGTLMSYWWFPIFYMLTTFVIVDWLPNILIRPKLSGGRIHPGLMMYSYIFGSIVFGFKGLFLGPLILVAVVDYFQIILPSMRKK